MNTIEEIVQNCKELAFDLDFGTVKAYKAASDDRVAVGYFPVYFPREIVHAVNGLAVGIMGVGDRKQIVKGDAYYQSYICHMPRGIIEMALDGNLDSFDGFVFPAICDVMRNLSGMFKIEKKGKFVKYLDYPQNFDSAVGGEFYRKEMEHIADNIYKINGVKLTKESLNHSISLYNRNRMLIEEIYKIRLDCPWKLSAENLYYVLRAGQVMEVEKHNELLEVLVNQLKAADGTPEDRIRVVISGAFCEQPPIGLIKTIEMSGCYIIDDDFLLGSRWIQGPVDESTDDPLHALSEAYLNQSTFSSSYYDVGNHRENRLIELAKNKKADGVIFASPSFCDPALLDLPIMSDACEKESVRYMSFQYHENTGQFKVIKEQVGAFSDSIKLWEGEPEVVC